MIGAGLCVKVCTPCSVNGQFRCLIGQTSPACAQTTAPSASARGVAQQGTLLIFIIYMPSTCLTMPAPFARHLPSTFLPWPSLSGRTVRHNSSNERSKTKTIKRLFVLLGAPRLRGSVRGWMAAIRVALLRRCRFTDDAPSVTTKKGGALQRVLPKPDVRQCGVQPQGRHIALLAQA